MTIRPFTRRSLLGAGGVAGTAALLAACGGSGGTSGGGSGTTMRLALNQTEDHPSFVALENFGEALDEATDGAWSIDVYPNETLGAQQETLQMVSNGSVEMSIVSGTQLENLNEDFLVLNMPGGFDDIEGQIRVLGDESIVGDLFASLEESQNIAVIGGFTQGERSVYTTQGPILTPDDLSGQSLRVQESDLHLAMAAALGATGTPLSYRAVYTGLNSGVIDAAENNEISYYTQAHHEVAPTLSLTRHLVGTDYLIINTDTLNSMDDDQRAAFDEGWAAAVEEHTSLWEEQTAEALENAEAEGAEINEVDADAFQEALSVLPEEFLTSESQTALWDAVRGAQSCSPADATEPAHPARLRHHAEGNRHERRQSGGHQVPRGRDRDPVRHHGARGGLAGVHPRGDEESRGVDGGAGEVRVRVDLADGRHPGVRRARPHRGHLRGRPSAPPGPQGGGRSDPAGDPDLRGRHPG